MSGTNTSATGGYLAPSAAPLEGQALENLLQQAVAGITSLPAPMVRPRWQPTPPTQPPAGTDWCAFGIVARTPDANAYVGHIPAGDGSDQLQRHEVLEILCSFYGPNCQANAGVLRDGFWIAQNREVLEAQNIGLVDVGPMRAVPDLENMQWVNRCDVSVMVRRQIIRTYPVLNLESAEFSVATDTGAPAPQITVHQ